MLGSRLLVDANRNVLSVRDLPLVTLAVKTLG